MPPRGQCDSQRDWNRTPTYAFLVGISALPTGLRGLTTMAVVTALYLAHGALLYAVLYVNSFSLGLTLLGVCVWVVAGDVMRVTFFFSTYIFQSPYLLSPLLSLFSALLLPASRILSCKLFSWCWHEEFPLFILHTCCAPSKPALSTFFLQLLFPMSLSWMSALLFSCIACVVCSAPLVVSAPVPSCPWRERAACSRLV